MNEARTNAGYTIIAAINIYEDYEIVLGEKTSNDYGTTYVTWECRGGNNYNFGNYIDDKVLATKDFGDRVSHKCERYHQWQKSMQDYEDNTVNSHNDKEPTER